MTADDYTMTAFRRQDVKSNKLGRPIAARGAAATGLTHIDIGGYLV
jgi:hypothetical protein